MTQPVHHIQSQSEVAGIAEIGGEEVVHRRLQLVVIQRHGGRHALVEAAVRIGS